MFCKYIDPASIKSAALSQEVIKGNQIQLSCSIDGNPIDPSKIQWKLNNSNVHQVAEDNYSIRTVRPNLSILTLTAQENFDGNVTCSYMNEVGIIKKEVLAWSELRVKRGPKILVDESILKASEDSSLGRQAIFKCTISSYPDATFKWLFVCFLIVLIVFLLLLQYYMC